MGYWETWPIILDQHSFKTWWVWPGPPHFHLNSVWTIWNRSLNILCEPSLLSSLRHPSSKFFKVFYQGACLRNSSLQAGWPTYSPLPSLFTLVSCSFLFPFTRAYVLIYRLLSHSPSIILFCAIQWLCVNVFSLGSPTVFRYWGWQSVLQNWEFKEQQKLLGSLKSQYSNRTFWNVIFSPVQVRRVRNESTITATQTIFSTISNTQKFNSYHNIEVLTYSISHIRSSHSAESQVKTFEPVSFKGTSIL